MLPSPYNTQQGAVLFATAYAREAEHSMLSDGQRVFAEQLTRDQHRIFAYIVTLVANRDDAEDIFQDACLVLWEKWKEYDSRRSFFGWACGVAHNKVRNKLRTSQTATVRRRTGADC
jgi:RNA polymerase sigma-70 factor, ECF subfamily